MTTVSPLISVFVSNHESYKNIRQPKGLSSTSKGRQEYVWDHHLVHLGSNWLEAFAPLMKPPMAPPTTFLSGHGMQSWHQRFGDAAPWGLNVDMQLFGCDESTTIMISYEKLGGWIFWHKSDMCNFFYNLSWSEASLGTYKFLRSEFYLTSLAVNHVFIPAQVSTF